MASGNVHLVPSTLTSAGQVQDAARFLAQPRSSRRASNVQEVQAPRKLLLAEKQLSSAFGGDVFPLIALPIASTSLIVLDLSFNDLDDQFWSNWTPALQGAAWPALATFNLANNQYVALSTCMSFLSASCDVCTVYCRRFSSRGLGAIAAFIARCPGLVHLDLSLNAFGERNASSEWIRPLINALEATDRERLQVLDLSCTGLADSGCSQLLEAGFAKVISKLYLRSNALTDEAAILLGNILPQMNLEVLSLAGNLIGDCGAASLAFVVDQPPALQTLDLEQNQIGQAGITSFYHAINAILTAFPLRYLHLGGNRFASELVLKQIHTKLHEKILETQMVSGPPNGTVLNLSGGKIKREILLECCLTDQYVHVVTTTIRSSRHWQALESLDLSGNAIGGKGACEVGLFLALQPPLKVLNLSRNLITGKLTCCKDKCLADSLECLLSQTRRFVD
jgi:Ran GTPase-activating protein (RanGAP) involved in mRNA processing and transport